MVIYVRQIYWYIWCCYEQTSWMHCIVLRILRSCCLWNSMEVSIFIFYPRSMKFTVQISEGRMWGLEFWIWDLHIHQISGRTSLWWTPVSYGLLLSFSYDKVVSWPCFGWNMKWEQITSPGKQEVSVMSNKQ